MLPSLPASLRHRLAPAALLTVLCPMALGAGACTLPTNVAIKDVDKLRAAQTTCLVRNAQQVDDRTSDPAQIARDVAAACNEVTQRLVATAIVKPSPQERRAFEEEAELRAAGYVRLARSGSL